MIAKEGAYSFQETSAITINRSFAILLRRPHVIIFCASQLMGIVYTIRKTLKMR